MTLSGYVEGSNDQMTARMGFLLSIASGELIDELEGHDEMTVRKLLYDMGEAIAWIGHGDNDRLPPSLRAFAEGIQPSGNAPIAVDSAAG